jgi:hemerythrin-like metal-binding protein
MADLSNKLLSWNSSMNIGVAEIDTQHKTLVDRLNYLERELKLGGAHDRIGELIHELGDYVLNHFRTEERYMEKSKYPGMAEHKEVHREFMKKIIEFDDKYKNGNVVLTGEMMIFLRDWVRDHIADMDQKLGGHLQNPGRSTPGQEAPGERRMRVRSRSGAPVCAPCVQRLLPSTNEPMNYPEQ